MNDKPAMGAVPPLIPFKINGSETKCMEDDEWTDAKVLQSSPFVRSEGGRSRLSLRSCVIQRCLLAVASVAPDLACSSHPFARLYQLL